MIFSDMNPKSKFNANLYIVLDVYTVLVMMVKKKTSSLNINFQRGTKILFREWNYIYLTKMIN